MPEDVNVHSYIMEVPKEGSFGDRYFICFINLLISNNVSLAKVLLNLTPNSLIRSQFTLTMHVLTVTKQTISNACSSLSISEFKYLDKMDIHQ